MKDIKQILEMMELPALEGNIDLRVRKDYFIIFFSVLHTFFIFILF